MSQSVREAFGLVIRDVRHERGLSQEALSFECNRHRTYISMIERGIKAPTVDTLWMLATALGLAPSELIRRTEECLSSDGS